VGLPEPPVIAAVIVELPVQATVLGEGVAVNVQALLGNPQLEVQLPIMVLTLVPLILPPENVPVA
jgi:fumarate hydratase class II